MGMTVVRRLLVADALLGGAASIPGTWYVGLSTTAPADDGSQFTEPTGGAYARVAVANDATRWPAASLVSGQTIKRNGAKITFPNPTAAWGALGWLGLFLTSTGGIPHIWQELETTINPRTGNTPVEFDPETIWFKLAG